MIETQMYAEVCPHFMEGKNGPQNCAQITSYPKFHAVWTAWLRVNITLRILSFFVQI